VPATLNLGNSVGSLARCSPEYYRSIAGPSTYVKDSKVSSCRQFVLSLVAGAGSALFKVTFLQLHMAIKKDFYAPPELHIVKTVKAGFPVPGARSVQNQREITKDDLSAAVMHNMKR
jgi:hypothetical protein